jgi:hypothetical protein
VITPTAETDLPLAQPTNIAEPGTQGSLNDERGGPSTSPAWWVRVRSRNEVEVELIDAAWANVVLTDVDAAGEHILTTSIACYVLQTETCLDCGAPSNAAVGNGQVDWVVI